MSRSTRSITAGIAAFAALAPAAAAMPQHGPIGVSGGKPHTSSTFSARDLRSPDARDAARAATGDAGVLRKHPVGTPSAPPSIPTQIVHVKAPDGFDWTDAVIGAGGAFAALVLAAGSGVALRRRVRHSLAA